MSTIPLVVDLDGTLLRTDLLIESGFAFIRSQPLCILSPIRWLASGKAYLKERLAQASSLDVASLPYDPTVIALLKDERKKGRQLVLATASHRIYADRIAEHLNLFNRVIATEGNTNLSALAKRDALVGEFGEQGFDYAGNSQDDLPVWAVARRAYVVNPAPGVQAKALANGNVERVIHSKRATLGTWAKALRLHQWLKNLLIYVPLLASHQLRDVHLLLNGALAFVLFGLCASSVYLLNDLLDLPDDRHHANKRHRPLASGELSIKAGLLVLPLLLIASFSGALWLLPSRFALALAVYYVLTLAYSLAIKRMVILDVITLAMLYTLRIIAGAFAFPMQLTFWMLVFSMFIFLSLALVKRYAELREARSKGMKEKSRGRAYFPDDLEMLSSLGAAAGYLSVLVLALYTQEHATTALYRYPRVIWLACPLLLYWISRTWMLTHRGQMRDDPVLFAIKDPVSLIVGGLFGAIFWLAT